MTFSIVAADLDAGDWGVAVASKFVSVGAVVPWARAGVGAVATQSWANTAFGPDGLALLREGVPAEEALGRLVEADEGREDRQVGIVDAAGRAATFTGSGCMDWAGGATGSGFAAQGNILVGEQVVAALSETFIETDGDLCDRLLAALLAGDAAGGDRRGRQSAALLVVREGGGYEGRNDRYIDLRVDDHPDPIKELMRIRDLHTLYFGETKPEDVVIVDGAVRREVADALRRSGYVQGQDIEDDDLFDALSAYIRTENFEERGYLDLAVLEYTKRQA